MKSFKNLRYLLCAILFTLIAQTAIAAKFKTVYKTVIFDKEIVRFNPDKYNTGAYQDNDIFRLGNGRVILKKVRLPKLKRDVELTANIELRSNGDSWDKTGSSFIIPANSDINMLNVAQGLNAYPTPIHELTETLKGVISQENYVTPVELVRFMTPFGVGYFNEQGDSIAQARRKPVYIAEWAPSVIWNQNVSDLYTLLTEEVYVGVFIDTWTDAGYEVSLDLELKESVVKQDKRPNTKILPLINTVYYQSQDIPDIFNRQDLAVEFDLPKKAKNVVLKYITTGHGGQSGGDEFVKCENILSLDQNKIFKFTPWRDDCASFRRFNPSTGTWLIKRETNYIGKEARGVKEIEEVLGSSDLSRSNWCPGSDVTPETIILTDIKPGKHKLTISIPEAQSAANGKLNHWLVSAYLVWEE